MATLAVPVEQQKKIYEQEALITGAEAIAVACKLANVDVVTAYPIRPYDTVMQYMSQLVADGEMDCEFIVAESENSLSVRAADRTISIKGREHEKVLPQS